MSYFPGAGTSQDKMAQAVQAAEVDSGGRESQKTRKKLATMAVKATDRSSHESWAPLAKSTFD